MDIRRFSKAPHIINQRAAKIHQLRQELQALKNQYNSAEEGERPQLAELCNILRRKFMTLQRAEWHKKRDKERARKSATFIANCLVSQGNCLVASKADILHAPKKR